MCIQTETVPATTGTMTVGSTSIYPEPPRKSLQCPFCTPRCPHGYPADAAPTQPVITWITPNAQSLGTVSIYGTTVTNANVPFTYTF